MQEGPGSPVWPVVLTLAALWWSCHRRGNASCSKGLGFCLCLQNLWGWLSFAGLNQAPGPPAQAPMLQSRCAWLPEADACGAFCLAAVSVKALG